MKLKCEETANLCDRIVQEVEKAVVGKRHVLEKILAALLSSAGHVLLEDFPGLAKTLVANSFSEVLGMDFKRIQFTPDLLPGDVTGGFVFHGSKTEFLLRKGPIFTNILLADEINRASPKTQSALLEAMQEGQVTLEGDTEKLPEPFIVIATQNPIEYEGTFPLPEAQLDRFLLKLSIGYPTADEEDEILKRRTERKRDATSLRALGTPETFLAMRDVAEEVFVHPDVRRYIVDLVAQTRKHRHVVVGASPRGSIALLKLSKAWAAIHGRNFVLPDDVKEFAQPALAHRIVMDPTLWDVKTSDKSVIDEAIRSVAVPVLQSAE
ncbi:MAG TPA: MoxR family ATPase [Spirochaetia bacterium]|nr:MoxR family ATPase [Spirochaetia bacterium]